MSHFISHWTLSQKAIFLLVNARNEMPSKIDNIHLILEDTGLSCNNGHSLSYMGVEVHMVKPSHKPHTPQDFHIEAPS